jgi:hypothetical protein
MSKILLVGDEMGKDLQAENRTEAQSRLAHRISRQNG